MDTLRSVESRGIFLGFCVSIMLSVTAGMDTCEVKDPQSGRSRYVECRWGCCYEDQEDPCCDSIYERAPFVIGVLVGVFVLIISIVSVVIICRSRLRDGEERESLISRESRTGGLGELPPSYDSYQNSYSSPPIDCRTPPPAYSGHNSVEEDTGLPSYTEATEDLPPYKARS
ncbi:uncharacterized protein LOC101848111 [Aplysia californica]|uniref:Uncharacterized protein LOC101848111 n=1 Tax=Aplysia californica TaxID=6500 RepID=A0ABM1A0C1_APLCA|nr:uncharacterized protein LOC101848111 [Aplysia californica]